MSLLEDSFGWSQDLLIDWEKYSEIIYVLDMVMDNIVYCMIRNLGKINHEGKRFKGYLERSYFGT